jgi:hypothetical protein
MSTDPDLPLPGPAPEVTVDPPEPPHPDVLDTITPGLTDESGRLADDRQVPSPAGPPGSDGGAESATEVATEEPTA